MSDIHFELDVPDCHKWKAAAMEPKAATFLLEEVLKSIDNIVRNQANPHVVAYSEILSKWQRVRCWIYLFLTLGILTASGWAAFTFFVCESCDASDYSSSLVNLICWGAVLSIITCVLVLCIAGRLSFSKAATVIASEWRSVVKNEIAMHLQERRKASPQLTFAIEYALAARRELGCIAITKQLGTPAVDVHVEDEASVTKQSLVEMAQQNKRMLNALYSGQGSQRNVYGDGYGDEQRHYKTTSTQSQSKLSHHNVQNGIMALRA